MVDGELEKATKGKGKVGRRRREQWRILPAPEIRQRAVRLYPADTNIDKPITKRIIIIVNSYSFSTM
jgi:hypothetical protein